MYKNKIAQMAINKLSETTRDNNLYRYFIDAIVNAFMVYPNSVENVTKLVNEINNCLDEPLSKEKQNQAIDILMQELRNDLSD
ncbi:hypothetical protein [Weissella sagaensis]|uniref:hypothetical protein n=1 Tax=Weissella sagaensis TaxID=2559928 RepID=UPI00214CA1A8|nr:hypothetical protein [Weissella sagaensis]